MGTDLKYQNHRIASHIPIYATGKIGGDMQCICLPATNGYVVHIFNAQGGYYQSQVTQKSAGSDQLMSDTAIREVVMDFTEMPVSVFPFEVKDWNIKLSSFSPYFQGILQSPSEYSEEEVLLAKNEFDRWVKENICCLMINDDQYWIDDSGTVVAS